MIKTSQKILNYINKKGQVSGNELVDYLGISSRAIRKQLNKLYADNKLAKMGKPPRVFYYIPKAKSIEKKDNLPIGTKKIINKRYLIITPSGEIKEGVEGFVYWCLKNNLNVIKTADDYIKTLQKYDRFKKNGLIDGMKKIQQTFKKVYVDNLFYLDFYSVERFGKTKLGQLLLYAKQSQNKKLIKDLTDNIKADVEKLSKKYKIDGVGYIPPTVKRQVQFVNELKKNLKLPFRKINLVKVQSQVSVPQKTLNKLDDRIENAHVSIVVDDNNVYNNILLIDDAVGSGATINETAKKIREKNICKGKIIGLTITGSFKGFDVISEV